MRFLFVDEISTISASEIAGSIFFSQQAPLTVPIQHNGHANLDPATPPAQIAPGLISEAIGQLASWNVLKESDFKVRPVFIFMERLEVFAPVMPGDTVALKSTTHEMSEDSVTFSGEAWVGSRLIQRLTNCTNFLAPIAEMENPELVRERFEAITRVGGAVLADSSPKLSLQPFITNTEALDDGRFEVRCSIPDTAPFYKDHFPRRPVTPIVILNEIIGLAAKLSKPDAVYLAIQSVSQVKIKSFVLPNEEFTVLFSNQVITDNALSATVAISKSGKPILRGQYVFDLTRAN